MPRFCLEDLVPGETVTYGDKRVDRDEIVAFARDFDPQAFHLDEEAAKSSFVGTLIASGWHTAAMHHRMLCDDLLLDSSCMGSPGIEELKWLRPVRPGDRLKARRTILERRVSASRPERGLAHFSFDVLNQEDQVVLHQRNWILFGLRNPGALEAGEPAPRPATARPDLGHLARPAPAEPMSGIAYFEDIEVGTMLDLGTYAFTHETIVAYGRAFDPQPFHVDAEAARTSAFGQLVSSGWHTAGAWMGSMARDRARRVAAAERAGTTPARLGPSPGFRELRWLKPVAPGDVVTYRSRLFDKRPTASRPGWGLVFHHNTGENQRGERVFEFIGCVFWECRPPSAVR